MDQKLILCSLIFVLSTISCNQITPPLPESEDVLAEPIAELNGDQLALHLHGDEEFARVFGVSDGLGPVFVQASCENCHVGDGKGSPFNTLVRFGGYDAQGKWSAMLEEGGPQLQHRSIPGYSPEELPANAISSRFIAPNVTGLGYLEAVTDEYILSLVDSMDVDGDGISGTINRIEAPEWFKPDPRYHTALPDGRYIGRFGRKGAAINLKMQTVGAYKQDMGITSDFDMEDPVNHSISSLADDGVADPEVPAQTIRKVVFYLQTLEAPRRRNADDPAVREGEVLFTKIGCESCHKSTLLTGPSEITALNQVNFHPYTDLLFHDMGDDLDDGYTEGSVGTSEWRTTPLWGLGLQKDSQGGKMFLLHDGRAGSYDEAIQFHGGEATASRSAYNSLNEEEKIKLEKFFNSL